MDTYSTIVKFFQDSGVFIYPSIFILATGLSIAIERFLFITRSHSTNRKLWAEIQPLLQAGKFQQVHHIAAKSTSGIGVIMNNGLVRAKSARRREEIESAMEEGMMEIIPRLERRTHYLATFANVVTLLGLLGTIIGLIKAFTAVAQVNPAEKAELLSASISIAMNNTAFGLMVAIPFLLIHAFLQARTAEIVDHLETARLSFLNVIERHRPEPGASE